MKCGKCGAEAPSGQVPARIKVAGHTFTGEVAGARCGACGEEYYDGPAFERFELTVAVMLSTSDEPSGESFKFMRKVAGLRAAELAGLLDVAAETVSRWETGALPVERRALALLAAILADALAGSDATLERLRAMRQPARLPKLVRVA